MSILSLASGQSAYRGYDYFQNNKVLSVEPCGDTSYHGTVSGSNGAQYDVTIDLAHPRKSQCTCPHAAGRRIICKHMVALYFTIFPEEAAQYIAELEAYWNEQEQAQEQLEERLLHRVHRMKKSELQEALLILLFESPEWQIERFLDTYDDFYEE